MKTSVVDVAAETRGNAVFEDTVDMKVSEKAMSHLAFMFSNIYNDPETAVWREYVANGHDAHFKANVSDPVQVLLPTHTSPTFLVKDTGVGMSLSTVTEVFSQYFESTKNTSNDEIGGWGIGAKSALAIASQFTVTTTHQGVTTKAVVNKSEIGVPKLGVLSSRHTGHPSGTTISVPIQNVDMFNEKALKSASFMYPGSLKFMDGAEHITYDQNNPDVVLDNLCLENDVSVSVRKHLSNGYYRNPKSLAGLFLVMGGIAYEVTLSSAKENVSESYRTAFESLTSSLTVIDAPIGSVDLSPNREGVQFTQKTKDFMSTTIESMFDKMISGTKENIETQPSYLEALKEYRSLNFIIAEIVGNTWNGLTISSNLHLADSDKQSMAMKFYRVDSTEHSTRIGFDFVNKVKIYLVTGGSKSQFKKNIGYYITNNFENNSTYYLHEPEGFSPTLMDHRKIPHLSHETINNSLKLDHETLTMEQIRKDNAAHRNKEKTAKSANSSNSPENNTVESVLLFDGFQKEYYYTTLSRQEVNDIAEVSGLYYVLENDDNVSLFPQWYKNTNNINITNYPYQEILKNLCDGATIVRQVNPKISTINSRFKKADFTKELKAEDITNVLQRQLQKMNTVSTARALSRSSLVSSLPKVIREKVVGDPEKIKLLKDPYLRTALQKHDQDCKIAQHLYSLRREAKIGGFDQNFYQAIVSWPHLSAYTAIDEYLSERGKAQENLEKRFPLALNVFGLKNLTLERAVGYLNIDYKLFKDGQTP